ncbi:MAG TPA: polymorphic toxin type 4 domain-containing protein [Gemmatimonadales bacterium]|nr:polymorphic toxin type 4 domain-containing protein [Gemmatimonadales bacterium]
MPPVPPPPIPPRRDALGGIVITSLLGPATTRQGYEKQFFPGIDVGLPGWERAHSQGAGTGKESPHAIRYAPAEVNQQWQRLGIERFLRELFKSKGPGVDLVLTTVTYTHPGTLRLKEIQYRVDARKAGRMQPLFEAAIEVGDSKVNPKVAGSVIIRTPENLWPKYLV